MLNIPYNSQLVVDTAAIRHNYAATLALVPEGTQVIPVLKSNAYGVGAVTVARALATAPNPPAAFGVAQASEAALLREAGVTQSILILGTLPPHALAAAVAAGATLTVYRPDMVAALAAEAVRQGKAGAAVHIKIETGLNRYGARPGAELAAVIAALRQSPGIEVTGVFSHFSNGEQANSPEASAQLALFEKGVAQLEAADIPCPMRHIAASGSLEWFGGAALDAVRIGRRLYIDAPLLPGAAEPCGSIRHAFTWRSWVVHTQHLLPGESVGYGGSFTAQKPTDVAVVCVGYGDGLLPELCGAKAPVLVNGGRGTLLATCMDACFVDATGLGAKPGDEVVFFGKSQSGAFLSSQEVAGLIGHEGVYLTSKLTNRVERIEEA